MSDFTSTEASRKLKITRQALDKRLVSIGLKLGKGNKYSLLEIVEAMRSGDNDKEAIIKARRKKLEEEARLLELDRMEREKILCNFNDLLRVTEAPWIVVRQRMLALSSEASAKANPADPDLAREALDAWTSYSLASIRDQLPKAPAIDSQAKPTDQPEGAPE